MVPLHFVRLWNGDLGALWQASMVRRSLPHCLTMDVLAESEVQMEIQERITQSQVRVKSGVRLVAFILLIVASAYLLDVIWLVKLAGVAAGFFLLVTLLEYWNVRRLKRRLEVEN
jgi:hypothetical protein